MTYFSMSGRTQLYKYPPYHLNRYIYAWACWSGKIKEISSGLDTLTFDAFGVYITRTIIKHYLHFSTIS